MPLCAAERAGLEALVRSGKTPQRVVTRARIVLASADGIAINAIAHELSVSRPTVYLWRDRFRQAGIVGLLKDAPRPGRRRAVSSDKIQAVVDATLHTTPPDATHWSVRTMARAQEVSPGIVHRIWQAHGLQPHRVETFKLSQDPNVVAKLRDVIGVYLHPPAKALVFCVDEKPQVQALDRTAPVFPLRPGIPARQTHDYIRHGTTNLFAALNVLDGTVLARCAPRKRHTEFPGVLEATPRIGPQTPRDPPGPGQLRYAHAPEGGGLVYGASAVPPPFRPDERVVAQSDRALVRRDHPQADSPRHLSQRAGPHSCDRRLCDASQSACHTISLDGLRQNHLAEGASL